LALQTYKRITFVLLLVVAVFHTIFGLKVDLAINLTSQKPLTTGAFLILFRVGIIVNNFLQSV